MPIGFNVFPSPARANPALLKRLAALPVSNVSDNMLRGQGCNLEPFHHSGRMVGTAEYLSPEQIRGEQVTPQTDVYALGCVIFETLTASSPFDAESDFVLMYAHLERTVPRMSERRPALPPAADDVVRKAMEKGAQDRFESAGVTIAALKAAFGYE